jgi:hypothetical protein
MALKLLLVRYIYNHRRILLGTILGPGPVFQNCNKLLPSNIAHEIHRFSFKSLIIRSILVHDGAAMDYYAIIWAVLLELVLGNSWYETQSKS